MSDTTETPEAPRTQGYNRDSFNHLTIRECLDAIPVLRIEAERIKRSLQKHGETSNEWSVRARRALTFREEALLACSCRILELIATSPRGIGEKILADQFVAAATAMLSPGLLGGIWERVGVEVSTDE